MSKIFSNLVFISVQIFLASNFLLSTKPTSYKISIKRVNQSVRNLEGLVAKLANADGSIDFSNKRNVFEVVNVLTKPYRSLMLRKSALAIANFCSCPFMNKLFGDLITSSSSGGVEMEKQAAKLFSAFLFHMSIQAIHKYDSSNIDDLISAEIKLVLIEYLKRANYEYFQNNSSVVLSEKVKKLSYSIPSLGVALLEWAPGCMSAVGATLKQTYDRSLLETVLTSVWFCSSLALGAKGANDASKTIVLVKQKDTDLTQDIADILNNISLVKIFGNSSFEQIRNLKIAKKSLSSDNDEKKTILKNSTYQGINLLIYQACILLCSIKGVSDGSLKSGDVFNLLCNSMTLSGSLQMLPYISARATGSFNDATEAMSILLKPRKILEKKNAPHLVISDGRIVFENVVFRYGNETIPAFDSSFIINPREKVGIVGSSGAGKTTMTNLLLRFYDAGSGSIKIDGQNISDVSLDSLRKSIGFVPQAAQLFNRSLMDNVRYGKTSATDEEVIEACKKAHIHDFITSLPEGYKTIVGQQGDKLSGGQRQRISIARAILKNASILILDEATSALDSVTETSIQNDMRLLMENRTAIIIAHRLATLKDVDKIFVFDAGKIVAQGKHDQLLETSDIYKKLWEAQKPLSGLEVEF